MRSCYLLKHCVYVVEILCAGFTKGSSFNLREQAGPQGCNDIGGDFNTAEFDVHQRSSLAHTDMLCTYRGGVNICSLCTHSMSCAALCIRSMVRCRYKLFVNSIRCCFTIPRYFMNLIRVVHQVLYEFC